MNNENLIQTEYISKCSELLKEKEAKLGRALKFHVTTFGCQMNARDSEKLIGILKKIGYTETEDEEDADLILFNTCTVRDNANQRVYGHLGVLKRAKRNNPELMIGLCGCMMQEESVIEKIKKSYRHVNFIFGTHNIFKLAEILYNSLMSDSMIIDIWKETDQIVEDLPVERKYPFKSGVNIMYGCNNFCSYCIVPYVRGRERSRSSVEIIEEIKKLSADGVIEVMLLGQNVNSYGKGLDNELSFPELLKEIEKIDGIERIRFMTSHPKDLSDELIDVMANSKKICHHLHLPLQSGSSRLLKDMNRQYDKEKYLDLALKIKERIPDIALTTDIIVGYPGETAEDVNDTIDVIKKVQYDGAFTFIYSKRTGTKAASMPQCDEKFVKEQFDRVLNAVREESKTATARFTGQVLPVLVEELNELPGYVTGRLSSNHCVHFPGDESLIGKIVDVKLDECKDFYFIGTKI